MLKVSPEKAITVIAGMPVKSLIGHQEQKLATIFSEERSCGVSATFVSLKRRPWQHVIVMCNLGEWTERAHRAPRQRFNASKFQGLHFMKHTFQFWIEICFNFQFQARSRGSKRGPKMNFLFFLTSITTRSERLIQSGNGQTKMAALH